jgi:hypothetical protein
MQFSLATHQARAVETLNAVSILPSHFENDSKELIKLIQAYYRFCNQKESPSYEISNITRNHDVDLSDDYYLDAIERTIANNIPNSPSLDRKRLYKIIADYYNTRGSENSIHSFFRIFYNEIISIIYPKELLFTTSDVTSAISDRFKIRDSYRYQEYSYIIKGDLPNRDWVPDYLKFVHPAGLKFFVAFVLNSEGGGPDDGLYGGGGNINDRRIYAADVTYDPFAYIIRILMKDGGKSYLTHVRSVYSEESGFVDKDLLRNLYVSLDITIRSLNLYNLTSLFRDTWRTYGKWVDTAQVGEFYDMTTSAADGIPVSSGLVNQTNAYSCFLLLNKFTKPQVLPPAIEEYATWFDLDLSPGDPGYTLQEDYSGLDVEDYTNETTSPFNNSFVYS